MNDPFQKKRPDDNWEALADDLLGSAGGLTPAPVDDDPLDLEGLDVEPEPVVPAAAASGPEKEEPGGAAKSSEVADAGADEEDDFGFGLVEPAPKPARA